MAECKLTRHEREDLTELERKIEGGMKTFCEVGMALLSIRDRRLYRAEHGTFEAYCRERWGVTKTHANRLIAAHGVVVALAPTGAVPPATEREARPLVGLPPETAAAALEGAREQAASEGRAMTAEDVAEFAAEAGIDPASLSRPKPPPDPRKRAVAKINAARRRIRAEVGRLDAGEQEAVAAWLDAAPGFLDE